MRGHGLDAEHKVLCPNPAVNSKPRCLLRTDRGVRRLAAPDPRPLGGTCMYLPRTVVLRTVVLDRSISCTPKGALQVCPCIDRDRRTATRLCRSPTDHRRDTARVNTTSIPGFSQIKHTYTRNTTETRNTYTKTLMKQSSYCLIRTEP